MGLTLVLFFRADVSEATAKRHSPCPALHCNRWGWLCPRAARGREHLERLDSAAGDALSPSALCATYKHCLVLARRATPLDHAEHRPRRLKQADCKHMNANNFIERGASPRTTNKLFSQGIKRVRRSRTRIDMRA